MSYRSRMDKAARTKGSNIVLAFDFPFEKPENQQKLWSRAEKVLDEVQQYFCAVKFNHHLTLPLGLFDGVQKLVKKAHDHGLITIMDCKANDIGSTNRVIAEYYYAAGFDALIANPFVGWEEGLEPIFTAARRQDRGVILLVYMSHKASHEGYGQTICDTKAGKNTLQYVAFAEKALKLEADGAIVGATYPEKISQVHQILGNTVPIYSPGIGTQGGEIKTALKAGATYLIVGRTITQASNPGEAAKTVRDLARF